MILSGKGRAFSAGGDLDEFKRTYENFKRGDDVNEFGNPNFWKAFIDFPKPIIAAINGLAVGFGLTVTLACDIRIASERAKFGCAFIRIGVTPEFGSSYFMPRLIGSGKAAELAFTGKMIDAQEAAQIGLVNQVVEHKNLMSQSEKIAQTISQMPAEAVKLTKQVLRKGCHSDLEQALSYESVLFRYCTRTQDHHQAVCEAIERINKKKELSQDKDTRSY
jgi:2-(1,2-epoxy-1,2-dihydrophenyl)acetyl-CoA isomerase